MRRPREHEQPNQEWAIMSKSNHRLGLWPLALFLASALSGCATLGTLRTGQRSCAGLRTPEVLEIGSNKESLFLVFKCEKRTAFFWGDHSTGTSVAVAKVKLDDLFGWTPQSRLPVDLGPGPLRPERIQGYSSVPHIAKDETSERSCLYVTGSTPNLILNSKCPGQPTTARLDEIFETASIVGYRNREPWAYAVLPIALPVAVAIDVAASPIYFVLWLKCQGHCFDFAY